MTVDDIIKKAVLLGACKKTDNATNWRSLCELFFSPQGREFCKKKDFPTLDMFRSIKDNVKTYNVFVETETRCINEDIALIHCRGVLSYSGLDKVYKIILMHGASAEIRLRDNAVVMIENFGGEYKIVNDGTGRILL